MAAAAAVAVILLVPIVTRVSYSGAWDGDPANHNHFVLDAVNTFVAEHAKGGDPLRGFLQCFYIFPKMLHEILLTAFILVFHGMRHISFEDVERFGAWFATLWTLAGFVVLYHFLRLYFTRLQSLAVMPLVALCGYILMYANFPRQNMPSHVLCWLAMLVYVRSRLDRGAYSVAGIFAAGMSYGAAVAVHYSATYLFFAFVGIEAALLVTRRQLALAAGTLLLCFAGATLVWFSIDLYYFIYSNRYPLDTNFFGQVIRDHHSFLDGMVFTNNNLSNKIAAFKLEGRKWWFLAGFVYRNLGPVGSLLFALGILSLPWLRRKQVGAPETPSSDAFIVLVSVFAISVLVSLEYFQNARKLMPFYPIWCVLLGYGLFSVNSLVGGLRLRLQARAQRAQRVPDTPAAPPGIGLSAPVILSLIAVHFLLFGPALFRVYECRRDAGYMRQFLHEHGISRILVAPLNTDSQMAPVQTDLRGLTDGQRDGYDYVVLHRLYAANYSAGLMAKLRAVKPIVSFPNQAATPLFWYEFPLKREFMDFDDSLTNERSLYRWQDVRGIFETYGRQPQ